MKQAFVGRKINEMSVGGIVINRDAPRNNRAKLDTGTFCNYDCEFCYYRDQLDKKTHIDIVKQRADYLKQYGIKQVDLSGGESSVSSDWFEILEYCNQLFEHVSCLSHGGRFANKDFLIESRQRGLKEILFSLHGSTPEVHDAITNRKGSFQRIIQAIQNAQECGMVVRLNCTVYSKNYIDVATQYAALVNTIGPLEVNFITFNYWGDVQLKNVGYREMTDAIKKCIDQLNKDIIINVRYTPFCYMEGYEQYVCNLYQHIYDPYDWNKEVYDYTVDASIPWTEEGKLRIAHDACKQQRIKFYHKDKECMSCKHFYICDGIEKELAGEVLTPTPGEKIQDVLFYRKSHFR